MKKRKNGKIKPTYTVKTCLSELEQICATHKKSLRGYKDDFRRTMQSTQRIIIRLRENKKLQEDFKRSVLAERRKTAGKVSGQKFILSLEVVAKATGAASRESRQIASKRAKVLDYLWETGVALADTARTIKSKGGIEKIIAEAASGRRGTEKTYKNTQKQTVKTDENHKRARRNDQEISVPVWMRLSDRDAIQNSPIGTHFTLLAFRVGQDAGDIKITKVEVDKDAASEDWDD